MKVNSTDKKSLKKPVSRPVEVSEEAKQDRLQLEALLIGQTDELARKALLRRQQRESEEIELRNGTKISIKQIQDFVTAHTQPYAARFPNAVDFFREMFRLKGWKDKDPNNYIKPAIVGRLINQTIYYRFHQDVLPALRTMAMPGGVRLHKFFQFLNDDGVRKLEDYRDDAITMMKTCTTWYEFQLRYSKTYGIPMQLRLPV